MKNNAIQACADNYLAKPFEIKELIKKLAAIGGDLNLNSLSGLKDFGGLKTLHSVGGNVNLSGLINWKI